MMKIGTLAAVSLAAMIAPAAAQERHTIQMREGGQTVLNVGRPFSSVAIAVPDVADALPRSDRTLILTGRKVGSTDIMIFSDADQLYHATIVVAPTNTTGKVVTHNKKDLTLYNAYQCNPVCQRIEDKFESKGLPEIIVFGGGAQATGGNINVIVPPGSTGR